MIYPTLEQVKARVAEFSKVFGDRPFTAPLHKLIEETGEAIASGEVTEFADCLICLLNAFQIKFPYYHSDDLLLVAMNKLDVIEDCEWTGPDENGSYSRIKKDK